MYHSVGPTSVFALAQSPVLGPGFKHNLPIIIYPHLHPWIKEKVPLKQKLLQSNQQLSFSVASVLSLSVQTICCGYLVWHRDHVHIPAQLYIPKMKHKALRPMFKPDIHGSVYVRTCKILAALPLGCLLYFLQP